MKNAPEKLEPLILIADQGATGSPATATMPFIPAGYRWATMGEIDAWVDRVLENIGEVALPLDETAGSEIPLAA